jgi:hypothetical protein
MCIAPVKSRNGRLERRLAFAPEKRRSRLECLETPIAIAASAMPAINASALGSVRPTGPPTRTSPVYPAAPAQSPARADLTTLAGLVGRMVNALSIDARLVNAKFDLRTLPRARSGRIDRHSHSNPVLLQVRIPIRRALQESCHDAWTRWCNERVRDCCVPTRLASRPLRLLSTLRAIRCAMVAPRSQPGLWSCKLTHALVSVHPATVSCSLT